MVTEQTKQITSIFDNESASTNKKTEFDFSTYNLRIRQGETFARSVEDWLAWSATFRAGFSALIAAGASPALALGVLVPATIADGSVVNDYHGDDRDLSVDSKVQLAYELGQLREGITDIIDSTPGDDKT
jgi:hypothetical protein